MRLLLFVTTSLSIQHRLFLRYCWPSMLRQLRQQRHNVNVYFYVTGAMANTSVFAPFEHNVHFTSNPGYQAGAIKALYDPDSRALFDTYDWVVRLNPDVILYNVSELLSLMMHRDVDAILANCNYPEDSPLKGLIFRLFGFQRKLVEPASLESCRHRCTHRRVMTDFMAFRGRLAKGFQPEPTHWNAEWDATAMLKRSIEEGRERWIYPLNHDERCRTRDEGMIMHEHSLDRCLAHFARDERWGGE